MNWVIMLIIALVVSYLIGSINFALIVSKIFVKKDVRKMGSGNAGMTNVIRTVGIVPGIITFVGDFGKGLAAPLIAKFLLFPYIAENAPDFIANFLTPEYGVYFCGFLCIIGHAYPIFFGFRGGKGVSTSIAVLFCINWIVATFVLTTFLVLFLITKIISIGSVLGAVEFPIFNFLINYNKGLDTIELVYIVVLSVLIASLVFLKHKDNIIRLNKGEEKQLSSHK
ncbi:MAG: glycerol-3-phosphate 1-O-acyltransferase PlsY [Acutalibacteraceae bacterium]|nr:glycerol-3-phosphate 1-O-acyltransferase PlsY [Clostridia bacterium]MBQ2420415.1 glycerol-3-phosphate 1-O-acyltransferase PlsY [Clostridia bacterium]MEE1126700.1 glycerol-3-phosphate 1-O-acyltransferase PlsY [Acutalibacteraceae bacterium]